MRRLKVGVAALMFMPLMACAEFYDGNKLLRELTGDTAERLAALGYVAGVHDSHRTVSHCTPDNVTLGQLTEMVVQFLQANPNIRHETADVLVSGMLQQVFPCRSNNNRSRRIS